MTHLHLQFAKNNYQSVKKATLQLALKQLSLK
jgi:hypothetical protein